MGKRIDFHKDHLALEKEEFVTLFSHLKKDEYVLKAWRKANPNRPIKAVEPKKKKNGK
jgi:hypothetical protein